MIAALTAKIRDMIPHPMGAPETPALRKARRTILATLLIASLCAAAFRPLHAAMGTAIIAILLGAAVLLLIQVPIYVRAKLRADDAWLTACIAKNREEEDA